MLRKVYDVTILTFGVFKGLYLLGSTRQVHDAEDYTVVGEDYTVVKLRWILRFVLKGAGFHKFVCYSFGPCKKHLKG